MSTETPTPLRPPPQPSVTNEGSSGVSLPTQMDLVHRRRALTIGAGGVVAAVTSVGLMLVLRPFSADSHASLPVASAQPAGPAPSASLAAITASPSASASPAASVTPVASGLPSATSASAGGHGGPEPIRSGKNKTPSSSGATRPPGAVATAPGGAPTTPPLFLP